MFNNVHKERKYRELVFNNDYLCIDMIRKLKPLSPLKKDVYDILFLLFVVCVHFEKCILI